MKGIGEYYKGEEGKIADIVKKNAGNVRQTVDLLLEKSKVAIEYIANHVMIEIESKLEELIGEIYFNLLNRKSQGEPLFAHTSLISSEELKELLPDEEFKPLTGVPLN